MKEFMMAALPWVIAGLCVAVLAVRAGRKENKKPIWGKACVLECVWG